MLYFESFSSPVVDSVLVMCQYGCLDLAVWATTQFYITSDSEVTTLRRYTNLFIIIIIIIHATLC